MCSEFSPDQEGSPPQSEAPIGDLDVLLDGALGPAGLLGGVGGERNEIISL